MESPINVSHDCNLEWYKIIYTIPTVNLKKKKRESYTFGCSSRHAIDREKIASELSLANPLAIVDIDEVSKGEYGEKVVTNWKIPVVADEVYQKATMLDYAHDLDIEESYSSLLYNAIDMCTTNKKEEYKNITKLRDVIRNIIDTTWPNSSESKKATVTIFEV